MVRISFPHSPRITVDVVRRVLEESLPRASFRVPPDIKALEGLGGNTPRLVVTDCHWLAKGLVSIRHKPEDDSTLVEIQGSPSATLLSNVALVLGFLCCVVGIFLVHLWASSAMGGLLGPILEEGLQPFAGTDEA